MKTSYGLTRRKHAVYPVTRLEARPEPLAGRDMAFVFNRECENADPHLHPPKLILKSKSLFHLLGKMYYWHFKLKKTSGGPPSFFSSDLPTMKRLYAKGLVVPVPQCERWKITTLGSRVYELNYWLSRYKLAVAAQTVEAQHAKDRLNSAKRSSGWVNPKPLTEPWNTIDGGVGPREEVAQVRVSDVGLLLPADGYNRRVEPKERAPRELLPSTEEKARRVMLPLDADDEWFNED